MKKTYRIYIFLAFAAFCWLLVAGWAVFSGRPGSSVDPIYSDVFSALETNPAYAYDYSGEIPPMEYPIFGAILPAPAVNSTVTAETMTLLAENWSTKLVLVVTFADDLGAKAITSKKDWQTSFGVIQTNHDAVDHLLRYGAIINDQKMGEMQDYFEFLPYFGRYFPDKKIVPLVFDSAAGISFVNTFLDQLADCRDGYKVIFLTREPAGETPLFTPSGDTLLSYFDAAATTQYDKTLPAAASASLGAIKHILTYDGNDAVYLLSAASSAAPTFSELAILYGKKE